VKGAAREAFRIAQRAARIPAETPYLASYRKPPVCADWMVELEGTELTTPHPVVEPVSDLRVRNGIFPCRDGRVKTEFSSPGDRYGDAGGLEKPAFRGTNARIADGVRSLQTGRWVRRGSNL
jgi:hypothetical protein